jgi:hypothetical protein
MPVTEVKQNLVDDFVGCGEKHASHGTFSAVLSMIEVFRSG